MSFCAKLLCDLGNNQKYLIISESIQNVHAFYYHFQDAKRIKLAEERYRRSCPQMRCSTPSQRMTVIGKVRFSLNYGTSKKRHISLRKTVGFTFRTAVRVRLFG